MPPTRLPSPARARLPAWVSAWLSAWLLPLALGCPPDDVKVDDSAAPTDDSTGCDGDAVEVCDGVDNNCDGRIDEGVQQGYYSDLDGDGFGGGSVSWACTLPDGATVLGGDCDDGDPAIRPETEELCNGADDDCDGEIEPGYATWYPDLDGDGYGDDATSRTGCDPTPEEAPAGGDCDDANPEWHPGAEDLCDDGVDQDCSGFDLPCLYAGEYDMGAAGAKVYAPVQNWMLGEYLDTGDINGDGYADVMASAMYANNYTGGAAIIYGPVRDTLSTADAGDHLIGSRRTTSAGRSVAVGDVNGDGIDDAGLGAPDDTCRAWVFFGPLAGDTDIEDADVIRTGTANTEVGHGMDIADVNGDGVADLLIGAYEDDLGGADAGAVFIQYGPISAGSSSVNDAADLTLIGESRNALSGRYVHAGAGLDGDVDGDGIGDVLVAAPYASGGAPYAGAAYLVHGGQTGDLDLAGADAKYIGERSSDYAGEGLALGDVNGDGLADVVLGTLQDDAYVIYGPATSVSDLGDADVILRSTGTYGVALSASDINGDGVGDLLVGARAATGNVRNSGAAYLYWGPLPAGLSAGDADASFFGEGSQDALGASVGAADLDGDGLGEILLGAPTDSTGGGSAGAIFVQYAR